MSKNICENVEKHKHSTCVCKVYNVKCFLLIMHLQDTTWVGKASGGTADLAVQFLQTIVYHLLRLLTRVLKVGPERNQCDVIYKTFKCFDHRQRNL